MLNQNESDFMLNVLERFCHNPLFINSCIFFRETCLKLIMNIVKKKYSKNNSSNIYIFCITHLNLIFTLPRRNTETIFTINMTYELSS